MKEVKSAGLKSCKAFSVFLVGDGGIEPEEDKFSGRPCHVTFQLNHTVTVTLAC